MVEGSIKRKSLTSKSLLLIAVLSGTCLSTSTLPADAKRVSQPKSTASPSESGAAPVTTPVQSAPLSKDSAPQAVQAFERRLFFKNYVDDPLPTRMARIEKQLFGQAIESSMEDRLARIEEVLRNKLEEERKIQEAEAYRGQQAAPRTGSTTGGAPPQRPPALTQQDEIDRARMSIQAAREEEITSLLADGVELYRQKRGMQAQEKFEQVLRLDPQNAQAHFNLGIIEETMGNFVEALASYKQAANKEPGNKEYEEAVQAIEKKANAQARSVGKRADLRVLAESANAAWKRGEYISALDLYQQLDAKEPNRALVKYNIGSIYLMLKDRNSAVEYYKQAHKLEPGEQKFAKAYQELAAEVKKEQQEAAKIEQDARKDWEEANAARQAQFAPPQNNSRKGGKTSKKQTPPQVANGQQFVGSPFAPYAVMGGTQNLPGMSPPPRGNVQSVQQQMNPNTITAQWGFMGKSNGEGVTVVNVGNRAASAGIMPGDDIKAVDGIQVSTPAEIADILSKRNPAQRIQVLLMRNGNLAVLNL